MKIRYGHVSNSSSSSFIVGFKKIPETVDEMYEMLFPGGDEEVEVYGHMASAKKIANTVFMDMQGQREANKNGIVCELCTGEVNGLPSYPFDDPRKTAVDEKYFNKYGREAKKFDHEDWAAEWRGVSDIVFEEHEAKKESAARKIADELFDGKFKDAHVFVFNYGDECPFGCVMEHGDIFSHQPNIRISKH